MEGDLYVNFSYLTSETSSRIACHWLHPWLSSTHFLFSRRIWQRIFLISCLACFSGDFSKPGSSVNWMRKCSNKDSYSFKQDLRKTWSHAIKITLKQLNKTKMKRSVQHNSCWKIQGSRWKRGMHPKCLLSIKGRSCNQTLLVHQDMAKKTTFCEKK